MARGNKKKIDEQNPPKTASKVHTVGLSRPDKKPVVPAHDEQEDDGMLQSLYLCKFKV